MITHRCNDSLKNQVSIRYDYEFLSIKVPNDYKQWRLFKLEEDVNYDTKHLNHISEIIYCPYCGVKLI